MQPAAEEEVFLSLDAADEDDNWGGEALACPNDDDAANVDNGEGEGGETVGDDARGAE